MKVSEKKVSFSSPHTKSSASPKGSDENDRSNHEMDLNLQNPKKQTEKHFMSPTVSAASKATFPKKKILAERNEFLGGSNSSNTHLSKNPNLDSKPSPKTIPKASSKNSPSSQKTPLSYNSRDETPSPGPYDPLTNYLSPRPQFLRYNPSRRKEIFLRLKMEDKEGDNNELSFSSSSASFDSKKAADDDEADSENSSSLLEDEESGDEIGTLLEQDDEVSDIESDYEAEEEEVGWSLRGVFQYLLLSVVLVLTTSYISSINSPTSAPAFQGLTLGRNQSYGIVEVGCKFFDGKREQQMGLLGLKQAVVDEGIEEDGIVSLELEDRNVESGEMVEELMRDGEIGEATDQLAEDVELLEKQTVGNIEEVLDEAEDVIEDELVKTMEVSELLVEDIELQKREESGEQIEDVKEVTEDELVKKGEVSDQMVGDIEPLGHTELLQGDAMRMAIPVSVLERWGKYRILLKGLNQHLVKVIFGVFTCASIVASLVLGSNIRRKGIASKHSSQVDKQQSTKPVVEEKPSLVLPAEREEQRMHFNSLLNTAPLNIEETYQIRAPSVELLGEFEVGRISSSLKTCAIESRMKDIVSRYSDVLEKDLVGVKAYSTPVQHHHQHDFSDISTVNSSSSEGLTSAKKKLLRKEFGNNDMATPTPLRRSARIHSRSVASP